MEILKIAICLLRNLQIQSAMIWAAAIIACSLVTKDMELAMTLTTAAGWHLVLFRAHDRMKTKKRASIA